MYGSYMNLERVRELAALNAVGALDGNDAGEWAQLLADRAMLEREITAFGNVAAGLAASLPVTTQPSPEIKTRLLAKTKALATARAGAGLLQQLAPPLANGFSYLRQTTTDGWVPLGVPGAYVKLLSFDETRDYAVVAGKLDAGARYPAHAHQAAEDVFVLSGDLTFGAEKLRAGDFHHAAAGTAHEVNFSEEGCTILAVISAQDLLAQFATASA